MGTPSSSWLGGKGVPLHLAGTGARLPPRPGWCVKETSSCWAGCLRGGFWASPCHAWVATLVFGARGAADSAGSAC